MDNFEKLQVNASVVSNILKSLANPTRLMILCVIREKELSVGDINEEIKIPQSTLSQHLAWLRNKKIVKTRRDAQTIYYYLQDEKVVNIIELLYKLYCNEVL